MNTKTLILATIALLASATVQAESSSTDGLRWDCARNGAPRYQEIAGAFGYENLTQARAAQPVLYRTIQRGCSRGADVLIVRMQPAERVGQPQFVALADEPQN